MKTNKTRCAAIAAMLLPAAAAQGAVAVDFSGGMGTPLQITLPAITWKVTDAAGFNSTDIFGIGIAVGQSPGFDIAGNSIGGMPGDWSSSGSLVFPGSLSGGFFTNNTFSGPNSGGIIWFGMLSNQMAQNNDTVTYAGGTISSSGDVGDQFTDGNYEVYLISGGNGEAVSTAATAVPEPTGAALALLGSGLALLRRRR